MSSPEVSEWDGRREHLRLVRHEITTEQYVSGLKDDVDRRLQIKKYRQLPEALDPRGPSRLRRLANFMIDGFNPYINDPRL